MTSPGPDWVEQARRFVVSSGLGEALSAGRPESAGPSADHPAECRWCPVCVGVAALRGRRPDLVEGLADVLTTAAAVLRAHAAGGAPQSGEQPPGEQPAGAGETPPPPGQSDRPAPSPAEAVREETVTRQPDPVQRIDVA